MIKRTIYHSESDTSKAGRTIRALLAFLTAGRYSVIFSFKITFVKREYNERRMRERALENLFIALVLTPVVIGITIGMNKCNPQPIYIEQCDSISAPDSTAYVMRLQR